MLGAHVDGTRLSMALLERTRRALQYLENNPDTKAVLSGGQGRGEAVSEAKAMYDYLTGHGISRERLILEERSTNTKENLDFSLEKIGDLNKSVGVVTNNSMYFGEWRSERNADAEISVEFHPDIIPGDF